MDAAELRSWALFVGQLVVIGLGFAGWQMNRRKESREELLDLRAENRELRTRVGEVEQQLDEADERDRRRLRRIEALERQLEDRRGPLS